MYKIAIPYKNLLAPQEAQYATHEIKHAHIIWRYTDGLFTIWILGVVSLHWQSRSFGSYLVVQLATCGAIDTTKRHCYTCNSSVENFSSPLQLQCLCRNFWHFPIDLQDLCRNFPALQLTCSASVGKFMALHLACMTCSACVGNFLHSN